MVWDQKAHTIVMVNSEEKEKPVRLVHIRKEIVTKRGVIRKISVGLPTYPLPLLHKKFSSIPST